MMNDKFLKLTNTVYKTLEFFPEADPLKNKAKEKALAIMDHLVLINETSGWASFQKEKVKVQLAEDVDILLGYLWIGKSQGWLSSVSYLIIANEYEKIKKAATPITVLTQKLPYVESQPTVQERTQTGTSSVLDNTGAPKEGIPNSFNGAEKTVAIAPVLPNIQKDKEAVILDPPAQVSRQSKILEFLGSHDKAQVMDLRLILPNITKRTIRRDLDELMKSDKIIRFGEFNNVFYKIKQ